jgi:hypothetical protein
MNRTRVLMVVAVVVILAQCGCGPDKYKTVEEGLGAPINCATAKGDIRMLEHEKSHVADKIAQGVSAFSPAGLVIGSVSGTEKAHQDVASGKYNKMIDKRIAEIKAQCGVR